MNELVKQVNEICVEYFGPATPRFIARQIVMHLHIEEDEFSKEHIKDLAEWIEISGRLLIDKETAKEVADKVLLLT